MNSSLAFAALLSTLSLLAWVWLVLARGRFWRTDQHLSFDWPYETEAQPSWPSVSVIIPARNEAAILPRTLPTLLQQEYPGVFHVFLVDDHSEDDTAALARQIASETRQTHRLTVIAAEALPDGWTGKLWALEQGIRASGAIAPDWLVFTDADIAHHPVCVRSLVRKAREDRLDLVSLMVHLSVETIWDRLLIPAFVYFFGKLYPFRWVNDPQMPTAAAAGGCLLLRQECLRNSGGLNSIAGEIIDDCALAKIIKHRGTQGGAKIWLGLTHDLQSLRLYEGLGDIWNMVARTAFTQLRCSTALLLFTLLAMTLLYLIPPLAAIGGFLAIIFHPVLPPSLWLAVTGSLAWALMTMSYRPMLRWYHTSGLYAPFLPLSAGLYTLMTLDSAVRFWRGRGGQWKGRQYPASAHRRAAPVSGHPA